MSDDNPKIKALRERQVGVEEGLSERKVVNFKDRSPFVPPEPQEAPPEPAGEPKKPVVDNDAIDLLEGILIQARKGAVRGCIVLTGMPTTDDPELVTDIRTDISFSAGENIQIFLGGLETTKADLFELHEDIVLVEEIDEYNDDED